MNTIPSKSRSVSESAKNIMRFFEDLTKVPKCVKRLFSFFSDILLIHLAVYISLLLHFEGEIPESYRGPFWLTTFAVTLIRIAINSLFGLYHSLWQYASIGELIRIVLATSIGSILSYFFRSQVNINLPISAHAILWMVIILLLGWNRMSYRVLRRIYRNLHRSQNARRTLIVGAGESGSMVIRELANNYERGYLPVALADDDPHKLRTRISGVPVRGCINCIPDIVVQERIEEIIIALPSAGRRRIAEIVKICQQTKCRLRTLPALYDIIDDRVSVSHIRDIRIEDLLGREEIMLDTESISNYLYGETILVTGGGGSIGSELCRQISRFQPKKLIILDNYENTAYSLQLELTGQYPSMDMEIVIASIQDLPRLQDVFRIYRPSVVFHAAAHKHVPLMEVNPQEAIKNNILGTLKTVQCAHEYDVRRFVLISTDKAVNPTNIMGATKRVAEMIIQAMDQISHTEFVAVRFGNVLDSNGSVIPIFRQQIARGGPVTVTHPDINRYFMTIPEAARLVIQAGAIAEGGEIFVLDMGDPVRIDDLARNMIRLSGLIPDVDIRVIYTGLRPGEKLFEELLLSEEGIRSSRHQNIYIASPLDVSFQDILRRIDELERNIGDHKRIREGLARLVPTYTHSVYSIQNSSDSRE